MKAPFMMFESNEILREISEFTTKAVKGTQTLMEIDEIDVGTAPKHLVYEEDKVKLYHYARKGRRAKTVPVLIVYALVNKQYVLDLQPDRSLVRNLLDHGADLYIIDWGYPTKTDMYLTMDDYINGYMNNCVDAIRESTGVDQVTLMGICQGGTFSAMYSAIYPEKVRNLVTLVAPFDFSAKDGLLFAWAKHIDVDQLVDNYRIIPGDFLNSGFLNLMPYTLNFRKYIDMLDVMQDKEKLLNFLRMEKWIFDSPSQSGECYRQFVKDLYQENKLVKGELKVGNKEVNLKNITMPVLTIYASADHLVPPSSTRPFNDLIGSEDKAIYEFRGGHIGVFVSSKSQNELAPTIADWLGERSSVKVKKAKEKVVEASAVELAKEPAQELEKIKEKTKTTKTKRQTKTDEEKAEE